MSDLIERQAVIEAIERDAYRHTYLDQILDIIKSIPSAQPDRELIEQLRWERDTAIQQLKDLGYGLGEKPKTDDTISRQAAIEVLEKWFYDVFGIRESDGTATIFKRLRKLPSVQPEPLTLRVNSELTKEEYDKLMRDIKNAPIMLLPFEQPDRKTGEWLHEYLQTAVDAGIITETQASRLMDRIAEDNT